MATESRYRGNDDRCPHCGVRYGDMKTGLTYREVFQMLIVDNSPDPKKWTYKRRGRVLGLWHEIKKDQWEYHVDEGGCPLDPRNLGVVARFDDVPF